MKITSAKHLSPILRNHTSRKEVRRIMQLIEIYRPVLLGVKPYIRRVICH